MNTFFSFTRILQPKVALLVLFIILAITQGCAEYHLTRASTQTQDHNYQGGTMKAWLWGKFYDPMLLEAKCQGQGINDVLVKRTYLDDLISVFTFGTIMPIEVQYRCKSPEIVDDEI